MKIDYNGPEFLDALKLAEEIGNDICNNGNDYKIAEYIYLDRLATKEKLLKQLKNADG